MKRAAGDIEDLAEGECASAKRRALSFPEGTEGARVAEGAVKAGKATTEIPVVHKAVVSCSRRTDVMTFLDDYMYSFRQGRILWSNPFRV